MSNPAKLRLALIVVLFVGCAEKQAAWSQERPAGATFYVASNGNDGWSGRLAEPNAERTDGPFATLAGARDAIRAAKKKGPLAGGGVTVLLRGGTYCLKEPLAFGPEDSGTEKGAITYAAYQGEKVTLKGSRAITGWKPFRDHIYQADVSGLDLGPSRFWELYYKDERQVLARFPNFDPKHPRSGGFLYLHGTLDKDTLGPLPYGPWKMTEKASKVSFPYDPKRLDPGRWSRPGEVRVHVWSWLNWNGNIISIKKVDRAKQVITLQQPASYILMEGNRFFVDNALEEMDAPGEWYYDATAKRLYFWPPDGENPEGKVSAPVLPMWV